MNTKEITLLYGKEEWIKNNTLKQIKKDLVDEQDLMNYAQFEGKDASVEQIMDTGDTLPFFAPFKLIVIRNSGLVKSGRKEDTQKFLEWLKKKPETTYIVLCEEEVDKRNALYKYIQGQYGSVEAVCPSDDQLLKMVLEASKERKIKLDRHLAAYLVEHLPKNIEHLFVELDKLGSYAGEEAITKQMIEEVCVFSVEQRVFELTKAVSLKKGNEALSIYNKLIESKESPIGILVLIARQYRILSQIKYLVKQHSGSTQIAKQVGLPHFVVQDMIRQVEPMSYKMLQEILEWCLESDEAIKTGKMEPVKCIEFLILRCLEAK